MKLVAIIIMAFVAHLSTVRGRWLTVFAGGFLLLVLGFLYSFAVVESPLTEPLPAVYNTRPDHPITTLTAVAGNQWQELLDKQSRNLTTATERYRARRGHHPPPGFAEWFEFAQSRNAIVVEDFFDRIYHDLAPYWAIEPTELRRQARSFDTRIVLRNGSAILKTDTERHWMTAWYDLVKSIKDYLPDLDMPLNVMDESRVIVPYSKVSEYVNRGKSLRKLLDPSEVRWEFMNLTVVDREVTGDLPFVPTFRGPGEGRFWDMARVGCPSDSPSQRRNIGRIDFANPPPEFNNRLRQSYHGYVANWTLSKDICSRPELQALHGTFIEPVSVSTTHDLVPLFGGSKIATNNDILIPPAMNWDEMELYSGGNNHGGAWERKKNGMMWRGAATGGRNKVDNWTGFQRHRFVSMVNATAVQQAEQNNSSGINFKLPDMGDYNSTSWARDGRLSQFLDGHVDAAFVHLVCFPGQPGPTCPYTDPYFKVKKGKSMKQQYAYKYLPDLDGNSFSGRYRSFLLSTSLPIKSTIYNEWHDSRLIPWAHFVPMDPTFMDIYDILEYFIGSEGRPGNDRVARKIALDGKYWAERVLRKEDMQIYVYRLLLEYARVCDDRRHRLGYVDDLVP